MVLDRCLHDFAIMLLQGFPAIEGFGLVAGGGGSADKRLPMLAN